MWPTIIVAAIIAVIVLAIIIREIRNKKQGKSACQSCGGNCSSCPGGCHSEK